MDKREQIWQSIKDAKYIPLTVSHNGLKYDFVLAFAPSTYANIKEMSFQLNSLRDTVKRGCNPDPYFVGNDWNICGRIVSKEISVA
jgi:hypothetical protein